MLINPNNQTNLYRHDSCFHELLKLVDDRKFPSKILLSGNKGIGKSTLAYHIINYSLSQNESYPYDKENKKINKSNKSFNLIKNYVHPNFYLIDLQNEKKNIDINQIRQLIAYTNKSTFNGADRFILIDNIELLNINSTNALLKILEEPNDNLYFILINNNKKILPTLNSRCINYKINLTFNESIDVSNRVYGENILDLINEELISYYNTPGDFLNLLSFSQENKIDLKILDLTSFLKTLIDGKFFKKNIIIKNLMFYYMELFF